MSAHVASIAQETRKAGSSDAATDRPAKAAAGSRAAPQMEDPAATFAHRVAMGRLSRMISLHDHVVLAMSSLVIDDTHTIARHLRDVERLAKSLADHLDEMLKAPA